MTNSQHTTLTTLVNLFEQHHGPDILAVEEGDAAIRLKLFIPSTTKWFNGHFPEQPVLPGVVQVDWAIKLAKAVFPNRGKFSHITNLKFTSVVMPDTELTLALTVASAKASVSFHYFNTTESFSTGNIKFHIS